MMFVRRILPIILLYGLLVSWRTKWNATLITVIPALIMGSFSAIMAFRSVLIEGGAIYCDTAPCAVGLMFFSVFGVWFIGIGSIVFLVRLIAKFKP